MDEGNHWEYESLQDSSFIAQENCFSVAFANDEKVADIHVTFSETVLREGVMLRRGKKSYKKVILA